MTSFFSRNPVGVIGLPVVVLGAVWIGVWWLFAPWRPAAMIAVHEFVTMALPMRPLAPALYIGGAARARRPRTRPASCGCSGSCCRVPLFVASC